MSSWPIQVCHANLQCLSLINTKNTLFYVRTRSCALNINERTTPIQCHLTHQLNMMALFNFSEFYRVTNSWYELFQMNLVYVTWSFIRTVLCGGRRHGHVMWSWLLWRVFSTIITMITLCPCPLINRFVLWVINVLQVPHRHMRIHVLKIHTTRSTVQTAKMTAWTVRQNNTVRVSNICLLNSAVFNIEISTLS